MCTCTRAQGLANKEWVNITPWLAVLAPSSYLSPYPLPPELCRPLHSFPFPLSHRSLRFQLFSLPLVRFFSACNSFSILPTRYSRTREPPSPSSSPPPLLLLNPIPSVPPPRFAFSLTSYPAMSQV